MLFLFEYMWTEFIIEREIGRDNADFVHLKERHFLSKIIYSDIFRETGLIQALEPVDLELLIFGFQFFCLCLYVPGA